MAGTLTVQNLQGPSTGANANKIIIPSGQTLDVSGGTLTPSAGAVVQAKIHKWQTATNTSSTSYIDATDSSFSFTPLYDDSLLLISLNMSMNHRETVNGNASGCAARINYNGAAVDDYSDNYETYAYLGYDTHFKLSRIASVTSGTTSAVTIKAQIALYTGTDIRHNANGVFYSYIQVLEIKQ